MKWLSPLVLALAAAVLGLSWDKVPERWPIHWGVGGHPNGWATKGLLGAFGPLLLAALLVVLFEVIARTMQASVERAGATGEAAQGVAGAIRTIELAVVVVLAASAVWLPLARPASPVGFVVFTVIVIAGAGITSAIRAIRAQPSRGPAVQGGPGGWRGNLVYKNPSDPRLWVPKRIGIGWTINFGHRLAWPMLLVLLVPPLVLVLATLFNTARH